MAQVPPKFSLMTKVVVVLDEKGVYQNAFASDETNFSVLQKGKDDEKIDLVEGELEPIE